MTVTIMSMGLIYGILYPPAYALTSVAMFISYWGTRVGISYWYATPRSSPPPSLSSPLPYSPLSAPFSQFTPAPPT